MYTHKKLAISKSLSTIPPPSISFSRALYIFLPSESTLVLCAAFLLVLAVGDGEKKRKQVRKDFLSLSLFNNP